ncbi:hypothetical protein AW736_13050 [Termitidicoccus mucosus]|uniref:Uncharacterized protein n=2 Tax=Termitidicoccus mucosus TaxID=1184151 RepID=A0A178IHM2_9BACT|nr:hypothetical protein AW736_13050 [Opitutaceae bacterium TSB47]
MTALIWALWQGNKRSYEWLLQHGADPNLQMPATDLARYGFFSGASAVSVAARHRDPWFLEITLKYGGNPNLYNPIMKETVIFDCISFYEKKHDGIAQLELLIKYGADLNAAHPSTPMMYAAIFNRYDMVYMMLEAGADPTIVISGKFSLLTDLKRDMTIPGDSLSQWRKEVIKLLREKGVTFDGDE